MLEKTISRILRQTKAFRADKLVFVGLLRATPCLPLWGRWQPEGLTEEVFRCHFAEKSKKTVSQRTSPDLASLGHPPQRGGQAGDKQQFAFVPFITDMSYYIAICDDFNRGG